MLPMKSKSYLDAWLGWNIETSVEDDFYPRIISKNISLWDTKTVSYNLNERHSRNSQVTGRGPCLPLILLKKVKGQLQSLLSFSRTPWGSFNQDFNRYLTNFRSCFTPRRRDGDCSMHFCRYHFQSKSSLLFHVLNYHEVCSKSFSHFPSWSTGGSDYISIPVGIVCQK